MTIYILSVDHIYKILTRAEIIPNFYQLLADYPLSRYHYELTAYKLVGQHLQAKSKINLSNLVSSLDIQFIRYILSM